MTENGYRIGTTLVHQGIDRDPATGACVVPVYNASTYHHTGGKPGEFDYCRSGNPSRKQVEDAIALLEGGVRGFAYSSGMAAIAGALSLLKSGDHLIAPDDLYGGTHRYLSQILPEQGVSVSFVDQCSIQAVKDAIRPETRGIYLETPSNPLFKVCDIRALAALAQQKGFISFLDNTFMTPLLQRPLDLGIDISIHSATKFLGGHSDLMAGLTATRCEELGKKLYRYQNAFGCGLSPFDCFLLSRGIKTLKVRLEASQATAGELARRLENHPAVKRTIYPGLEGYPYKEQHFAQAAGAGALISFELADRELIRPLLQRMKLPIIAPSLGGVETILTHCWSMSHAAIPAEIKNRMGLPETLMRISVGLEDVEDLWEDLEQALARA